jgi:hypothetical protein
MVPPRFRESGHAPTAYWRLLSAGHPISVGKVLLSMPYNQRFGAGSSYSHNLVFRDPVVINPIDPSLPRKKDDRRAKVLLVVGDGFTQSFLQSQSLASSIPCRMNDLFPAASCVEYVPVQHDQFTRGPLWDPSKFPSVVNAWNAGGMNPWDFVSQFAKSGPMNNAVSLGSWSFKTASPEYQLRAYLWHYFRWVNEALSQSKHDFSRWKWSAPLSFLANSFNLSCVSYNYDCFLETAVSTLGAVRLGCPVERVVQFHDCLPERDTLVLKPHGSATFGNFFQMLPREDSANLWLEDVAFERNGGNDWETVVRRQHDCFPTLPDLVPPGHSYEHLSNPMSETRLAAELFATLADFVACSPVLVLPLPALRAWGGAG